MALPLSATAQTDLLNVEYYPDKTMLTKYSQVYPRLSMEENMELVLQCKIIMLYVQIKIRSSFSFVYSYYVFGTNCQGTVYRIE